MPVCLKQKKNSVLRCLFPEREVSEASDFTQEVSHTVLGKASEDNGAKLLVSVS
jgi:hypothetical protein